VALTPFAGHLFGAAFAHWSLLQHANAYAVNEEGDFTVCIGRDPRLHGERLADAFARGVESVDGVRVVYTDVANTPSMYEFVRADKCDAAVMITASHLPEDKNGLKFFSKNGGLNAANMDELIVLAQKEARGWYDMGILPPSSGKHGVACSELVNWMPSYEKTLKEAIKTQVGTAAKEPFRPLSGIKIVVNPGNGSGCFFHALLRDLGANVDGSMHLTPDGSWPATFGVPNPEKKGMVEETMRGCEACDADIGVMFDTDADRAGFVLPRVINQDGTKYHYEPLNGNRLIALLSVMFSTSSPGCTIVTDSTTSEGLSAFLEDKLGLRHFRFLRGYANVIGKARELTDGGEVNAEVAIETSGHCAMRENGYVDDGTYTAVKIIGLLARTVASGEGSLLELISELEEMAFVEEFRIQESSGSLDATTSIFDQVGQAMKEHCDTTDDWTLDEDNLEGVRVRLSSGGFFMIRQSLHDPVISFQVESISQEEASEKVLKPLLRMFQMHESLDCSALE